VYIVGALVVALGFSLLGTGLAQAINSGEGDLCHAFKATAIARFCFVILAYEVLIGIFEIVTPAVMKSETIGAWIAVHWMIFVFDIAITIWAAALALGTPRAAIVEGIIISVISVLKLIYAIMMSVTGTYKRIEPACCTAKVPFSS